ncbi:MAG TPA: metallophosphoesterase [Chthoniobacteraceae bacterium]|nr:metallophosphoesterase [Chthoniobacteraceae bacterium]
MTRFVYLSDTHLGTASPGYQMQPACAGQLGEIFGALEQWIREDGAIDFVLHGGDLLDNGRRDTIAASVETFRLPVPTFLCLGNHDLTEKESLENWLSLRPDLFPQGRPEFTVETADLAVHVVPNHWNGLHHHWPGEINEPCFFPDQMEALDRRCRAAKGRVQIVATHTPIFGLPPAQTGLAEPLHEPEAAWVAPLREVVHAHPGVRCVLGGHSHLNMCLERERVHYITASALVETPFEFKLFEIGPGSLTMQTIPLADRLPFAPAYRAERAYVQGRECDRALSLPL